MDAGPWNWLEITKIAAGLLVPVTITCIGIYVHRVSKRFEHLQWRSQKLVEKRLAIYDDLAPQFNDLLCYFTYVGCWRDLDPPDIVALKRKLDKKIHLAAPLFSKEFFVRCAIFQDLCFETYTGWGMDARLRTHYQRRHESRDSNWKKDWEHCFSPNVTDPDKIVDAYKLVMDSFTKEIGVHAEYNVQNTGKVPENVF